VLGTVTLCEWRWRLEVAVCLQTRLWGVKAEAKRPFTFREQSNLSSPPKRLSARAAFYLRHDPRSTFAVMKKLGVESGCGFFNWLSA